MDISQQHGSFYSSGSCSLLFHLISGASEILGLKKMCSNAVGEEKEMLRHCRFLQNTQTHPSPMTLRPGLTVKIQTRPETWSCIFTLLHLLRKTLQITFENNQTCTCCEPEALQNKSRSETKNLLGTFLDQDVYDNYITTSSQSGYVFPLNIIFYIYIVYHFMMKLDYSLIVAHKDMVLWFPLLGLCS